MRQLSIADITSQLAKADVTCISFTPGGARSRERYPRSGRAGRAMIAVAYAGGLSSGVSGVSRSNGLTTARDHVGGYLRVERGSYRPWHVRSKTWIKRTSVFSSSR